MCCMYTVYSRMQEWVIQIPSIPSHEALGNTETETTQDNVFDVPVLPQGERSKNPLGEGKNFFELLDELFLFFFHPYI